MGRELEATEAVAGCRIEHGDRAPSEAHIDASGPRIHADIVRIVRQPDLPQRAKGTGVEHPARPITTVRDKQSRRERDESHTLRFTESGKAPDPPSRAQIQHFDRVVPQRDHEEPLPCAIQSHVVDTALDTGKWDGHDLVQERRVPGWWCRGQREQPNPSDHDDGSHRPTVSRAPITAPAFEMTGRGHRRPSFPAQCGRRRPPSPARSPRSSAPGQWSRADRGARPRGQGRERFPR